MERITVADDPRLADYRHLNDASARRSSADDHPDGVFIVEGRLAVERLLETSHRVRSILVTPAKAAALKGLLGRSLARVLVADREVLRVVTGFDVHRGVLASASRPPPADPSVVVAGTNRLLALEAVNDNENLGALVRTASALGFGGLLLDRPCADPLYRRSIRVSSGWTLVLPHARVPTAVDAIDLARHAGHRVVALTPAPSAVAIDAAVASGQLDGPLTLLAGAEGPGLSDRALAAADLTVRIPMAGRADSLNVATAVGVAAAFVAARRSWT